jgi:hypothetical protein
MGSGWIALGFITFLLIIERVIGANSGFGEA